LALQYFQESCHKTYVQDIERKDLLKFSAFLRYEKEVGMSAKNRTGAAKLRIKALTENGGQTPVVLNGAAASANAISAPTHGC